MLREFKDDTFEEEVLNAELPVLVDFFATWCGPCKMVAPIVEELAAELDGKVIVGKIDIDENMATAQKYKVMSVPTFVIFKNGEVKETLVGGVAKAELMDVINKVVAE